MTFSKVLLYVNSFVFSLYGLAFIFWPEAVALIVVDSSPSTSSAVIDLRATYGGMMLGVGLLFAVLLRTEQTIKAGVQGVLLIVGLMAVSRALGIVVDGDANPMMYAFLAAEVFTVIWAAVALKKLS